MFVQKSWLFKNSSHFLAGGWIPSHMPKIECHMSRNDRFKITMRGFFLLSFVFLTFFPYCYALSTCTNFFFLDYLQLLPSLWDTPWKIKWRPSLALLTLFLLDFYSNSPSSTGYFPLSLQVELRSDTLGSIQLHKEPANKIKMTMQ